MTSDELKKLLNEHLTKKALTTYSKNLDKMEGFVYGSLCVRELVWPLFEALENHHNLWSDNDNCMSECSLLCKSLTDLKEKLKGG